MTSILGINTKIKSHKHQTEEIKNNLMKKLNSMAVNFSYKTSINPSYMKYYSNYQGEKDDLEIKEENYLKVLFSIFKKGFNRNLQENQLILGYLQTMSGFVEMIKKVFKDDHQMLIDLLSNVSFCLLYENEISNSLLFKHGEKGEKFYIILKGSVDILIPNERKVWISENDYINYLAVLEKYDEKELHSKCLEENRILYGLDLENEANEKELTNDIRKPKKKSSMKIIPTVFQRTSMRSNSLKKISFNGTVCQKTSTIQLDYINPIKEENNNEGDAIGLTKNNSINSTDFDINIFKVSRERITPCEYINRLKVYTEYNHAKIDNNEKIVHVTIFEYHNVLTLTTGNKFGDLALESATGKRTATVITREDCHFGILNTESYAHCIHEVNEKTRRANQHFIMGHQLFASVNKNIFEKKYYNDFINIKLIRGRELITENTEINSIYFIKDGEYEVNMYQSLYDLTQMIKCLDKEISNKEKRFLIFDENKHHKYLLNNPDYTKYYHKKRYLRISIIKEREVIGLNDYIFNKKSGFTVHCSSLYGEVFELKQCFFDTIRHNDYSVKFSYEKYKKMKKDYLLERLINIRDTKLESFVNLNAISILSKSKSDSPMKTIEKSGCKTTRTPINLNFKNIFNNKDHIEKNERKQSKESINYETIDQSFNYEKSYKKMKTKKNKSREQEDSTEINKSQFKNCQENIINKNVDFSRKHSTLDKDYINNNELKAQRSSLKDLKLKNEQKNISVLSQHFNINNSSVISGLFKNKSVLNLKYKSNVLPNNSNLMRMIVIRTDKKKKQFFKDEVFKQEKNGSMSPTKSKSKIGSEKTVSCFNNNSTNLSNCDNVSPNNSEKLNVLFSNHPSRNNFSQTMNNPSPRSSNSKSKINYNPNSNQFSLSEYYLQPSESKETEKIISPKFKISVNTNEFPDVMPNTRKHTKTKIFMNEKAKNLYSLEKMQMIRQIRYNEEDNYYLLDAIKSNEIKHENYITTKVNNVLSKTTHNMFRWTKKK